MTHKRDIEMQYKYYVHFKLGLIAFMTNNNNHSVHMPSQLQQYLVGICTGCICPTKRTPKYNLSICNFQIPTSLVNIMTNNYDNDPYLAQ